MSRVVGSSSVNVAQRKHRRPDIPDSPLPPAGGACGAVVFRVHRSLAGGCFCSPYVCVRGSRVSCPLSSQERGRKSPVSGVPQLMAEALPAVSSVGSCVFEETEDYLMNVIRNPRFSRTVSRASSLLMRTQPRAARAAGLLGGPPTGPAPYRVPARARRQTLEARRDT